MLLVHGNERKKVACSIAKRLQISIGSWRNGNGRFAYSLPGDFAMTNNWRTRENDMFMLSIALAVFAGGLAYWLFRFHLFLGIVVFLFVFFFVYDRTRPYHKTMMKVFPASLIDSRQVVKNVLEAKGLPYKIHAKGRFVIEDELEIQIGKFRSRYGEMEGTAISLTPKTSDSQQLIFSLRQKLDEAFRPRGL